MAEEKPHPIVEMLAVDDEAARNKSLPEPELNTEAPEDKKEPERDESGKFKGKEGEDKKPDGEKKPDDKKPPTDEKPKETVPLAKYLEDKNSLKRQLDERDITVKQYEQRIAALEAKLTPKEEPAKAPDFVEDPKGYVDHQVKAALDGIAKANEKAETEGKKAQETAGQAAEQVQLQRFFTDLQSHESRFVQANPDYYDALAHVRNVRAAQLREFSPDITDQQIMQVIRQEETQLSVQLARQGRDPVQTAYNLAKHYGYTPKPREEKKAGEQNKLPDAPGNKRLPPDQTLGTGASEDSSVYKEGEKDPVDDALASLFKKRA